MTLKEFDREFTGDVIGIDEAGRGPLAGPVVVSAVNITNYDSISDEIKDSKKLSEKKREELYKNIMENANVEVAIISSQEIDKINILQSTFKGMKRVVENISKKVKTPNILVDGNKTIPNINLKQKAIVKGDNKSLSIAAASIIAKVTRDRIMKNLAIKYPQYSFERHKGYGTKKHIDAIRDHGPIENHRKTFLKNILL